MAPDGFTSEPSAISGSMAIESRYSPSSASASNVALHPAKMERIWSTNCDRLGWFGIRLAHVHEKAGSRWLYDRGGVDDLEYRILRRSGPFGEVAVEKDSDVRRPGGVVVHVMVRPHGELRDARGDRGEAARVEGVGVVACRGPGAAVDIGRKFRRPEVGD